ncbi:MAG TPA: hypothetical protein VHS99_18025, partial [Chloroflexota bacterium]|nr:hypothetical protein [Chloroflexota bacterium]
MIAHPSHPTNRYSPPLLAAALACGLASVWLQLPASGGWLASWRLLTDAFVSAWILLFAAALASLWGIQALGAALGRFNGLKRTSRGLGWDTRRTGREPADQVATERGRLPWWWALLLLAVCTAELMTHAGERNGFLATSRPESGVETWTNAEGYATLLDGMLAQGDGLFLLSLVKLFLGEGPPGPGEFDRRAGHLFLVALLQRPFGTYWAFAVTNLLSWWAATLAVWWLGQRRWPGTLVPWVASALAATGLGFAFMVAAPQPHAVAFGAFALVLLLADRAQLWEARPSLTA